MHVWNRNHSSLRIWQGRNRISKCNSDARNELLHIESGMSHLTNTSLKLLKNDQPSYWQDSRWCYLVALKTGTQGYWLAREVANQFRICTLVAKHTGERSTLAWHHNLQDLMLGARCGLEVSETVLTKWRNPEEAEEVVTSGSFKDASKSDVLMESVIMKSKSCSKSATLWSRNE